MAVLLVAGMAAAIGRGDEDRVMGGYMTSLEGRTQGQRMNALRAAQSVDGAVIPAGQEFSFNRRVGSWTPDRGYVQALVSYDGEMVVDWGGGVCQTSSALYNAALLAGLDIVERHRHTWAPKYVPPGRDAAVAQYNIDLRLRNPYPWPVRVRARLFRDGLGFEFLGRNAGPMAAVHGDTSATTTPLEVIRTGEGSGRRLINRGRPGTRVSVYRTFLRGPRTGANEQVSRDTYPAMNRIVVEGNT